MKSYRKKRLPLKGRSYSLPMDQGGVWKQEPKVEAILLRWFLAILADRSDHESSNKQSSQRIRGFLWPLLTLSHNNFWPDHCYLPVENRSNCGVTTSCGCLCCSCCVSVSEFFFFFGGVGKWWLMMFTRGCLKNSWFRKGAQLFRNNSPQNLRNPLHKLLASFVNGLLIK